MGTSSRRSACPARPWASLAHRSRRPTTQLAPCRQCSRLAASRAEPAPAGQLHTDNIMVTSPPGSRAPQRARPRRLLLHGASKRARPPTRSQRESTEGMVRHHRQSQRQWQQLLHHLQHTTFLHHTTDCALDGSDGLSVHVTRLQRSGRRSLEHDRAHRSVGDRAVRRRRRGRSSRLLDRPRSGDSTHHAPRRYLVKGRARVVEQPLHCPAR